MSENEKARIALGMSGGVDSAVAAYLLARGGWDVVGVTCVFRDDAATKQALADAAAVAQALNIAFKPYDARELFSCYVTESFVREYEAGATPSPCVDCNAYAKLPALIAAAEKFDCEAIATGHYARMARILADGTLESIPSVRKATDSALYISAEFDEQNKAFTCKQMLSNIDGPMRFAVQTAAHGAKDQSYMLACVSQDILARLVLPLGNLTKQDVRNLAATLALPVAQKPESQDICFAPAGYRDYLAQHQVISEPGPIVNTQGKVLGTHSGLCDYTIGQRKGIGVAAPEPYYVIDKQASSNELVVGFSHEAQVKEVIVAHPVWQAFVTLKKSRQALVKLRYRAAASACIMEPEQNGSVRVVCEEAQAITAPGQYAVFYDGDVVLGGGKITEVRRA